MKPENKWWVYWYKKTASSPAEYYGVQQCRYPASVAMWRMLKSKLHFDNLHSIGYTEKTGLTEDVLKSIL
jgi:hypothetical protein